MDSFQKEGIQQENGIDFSGEEGEHEAAICGHLLSTQGKTSRGQQLQAISAVFPNMIERPHEPL